ncbi:hybrid sensor histidine kinase/response regulator [Flintibacter muris]|uniref:hybrid sensor histidine kinase/response regulator n=1 Tax=Flintibacter muris TaxID=2941327 RepID=UPI002040DB1C|nr:response regulator [Flintibacter muris]
MKPNGRKQNMALPAALACGLLLFLVLGGVFFTQYLKEQIFVERTAQLVELTTQVRSNLDNALDTHWNYLAAAVNTLKAGQFDSGEEVADYLGDLEQLLETDRYSSTLMLLDSQGNGYDAQGRHGVWSDISQVAGGEERYTFISDSYLYEGSFWAFVQKLDQPLRTADGLSFTHAVLLKDVHTLTQYYDSAAYGHHSESYILKSNGTRMHDISQGNTLQAYNVLKALEEMEGQRYPDIRAAMAKRDTLSANFRMDGQEYYYCVTALDDYDTLLLFLIPADFVASGTVNMVNTVIFTLLFLAAVVLVLVVLAAAAVLGQRSSVRLYRQEQANLRRQEELNQQLEEYNAMLAQSKESAEQAFQIAEEANRAKSSFLSNMSHDIRTPMNAIVGFAALLARDADNPDKVLEYTKKITASSQHLLGLINDILDISKIEAGKTTLNLTGENMVDLIESIDSIIRPQMRAKGHQFEVYTRGLNHEQVVMDKLRLNQILLNLLSNAVKYTPDGGRVTFTVQELPQHAKQLAHFRFTVADNGYGMSEEYQKKLFQAFTREEDSVTNKIQGTGLGMAITKNLLDLMGGAIAVDSKKGRGTTFTVDLELQISGDSIDQDFWKKHNITRLLTVDDEEVICQNIQLAMEGTGVSVDYTLSGAAAVELVKQSELEGRLYNIVLLDWKMPGMDGVETARRIREAVPKDIPVLVLTSYDWPEIEEEARAAGVDAFLSKPFFLSSLRQKMDSLLSRQQEEPQQEQAEHGVLQGLHILVAEDNEINAEILSELLDMAGCTCQVCENGQMAVEAFAQSAPGEYQLILMDVQMPVMNGYDATRAIRKLDHSMARTVPIVAMTANAFAEDIRDALESGMNAHVAKPIDMEVLERTVREVLPSPQGDGS